MRSLLKVFISLFFTKTFWVDDVHIIKETHKAYLLQFCNQQQWYPKSKIYQSDDKHKRIKVDKFWMMKFT